MPPRGFPVRKRVKAKAEGRRSPEQETRKAREDAMPHERGSMPVLPSEFSITTLSPIPKLAL